MYFGETSEKKQRRAPLFFCKIEPLLFDNSCTGDSWCGKTLILQHAEKHGGGKWESNPSVGVDPHNAFEEREAHQLPFYLHIRCHYNKRMEKSKTVVAVLVVRLRLARAWCALALGVIYFDFTRSSAHRAHTNGAPPSLVAL